MICEAFTCTPLAAIQAWRECPMGLIETILEYRAYAEAKRLYETVPPSEWPASEYLDLVRTIDLELAAEAVRGGD
jgi:hypothetical protein